MTELQRESISNLDIDAITIPQIDESDNESSMEDNQPTISPTKKKLEKWDWNALFIPLHGPIIPSLPLDSNQHNNHNHAFSNQSDQHSISDNQEEEEEEEKDKAESFKEPPLKHTTEVQYVLRLMIYNV